MRKGKRVFDWKICIGGDLLKSFLWAEGILAKIKKWKAAPSVYVSSFNLKTFFKLNNFYIHMAADYFIKDQKKIKLTLHKIIFFFEQTKTKMRGPGAVYCTIIRCR